ncbi:hypothetical protein ACEPAF_4347 [Sanghuangporus sanghuang]
MKEPEHNGHKRSLSVGNTTEAIVESQSTQLLDFVLGRTEPSHLKNGSNAQRSDVTNSSADRHSSSKASVDTSSQNHPSASVSPYHLHGLASTQSPTQIVDSEDSQKENEHAQAQAQAQLPSRRGTRDTRSRTTNRAQAASKAPLTPSHVLSAEPLSTHPPPLPQPAKAASALLSTHHASVQKEKEATEEKAPAMRFRRRPSPPIPSQDSFAGPTASQDPDLFIATSRQFDIPVDQLGRSLSQERSPVESRVAKTSVTSSDPTGINPAMDEYSLSSDSSAGRILVADSQSSSRSRGSLRDSYYSISQEPTQIVGGSSDAGTSDRVDIEEAVVEEAEVDQVPDASTRVEPSQVCSQEPTQIVEETHSIEVDRSSAPGASVMSDEPSALRLVPPEKRHRYMHHFTSKSDARPEPTPGPSTFGTTSAASPTASSSTTGRRSLLDGLPPEKRARYMHHIQKGPAPVSEASHMATAGTSVRIDNPERPKSLIAPPLSEKVLDDSERQIEMDILPAKVTKSRDQEVIPASESDAPDGSREEQEVDLELGVVEESPTSVRVSDFFCVGSSLISHQSPLAASAKGKQKIIPFASVKSPRKNSSTKPSPATSPIKPRVLGSPAKIDSHAVRTKAKSSRAEGTEMGPPPVPEERLREPPRVITRAGVGNKDKPISPFASTSAAALHRDQRPETPTIHPPDSEQDSPEVPLSRLANRRREEEEESESGDAEDDEITLPEEDEKPRSRGKVGLHKRKRRNPAVTTKKGGKGKAAASRKATTRATSVAPPPSKKARNAVAKRFGAGIGTQVFALFKQDSCFYGAEVHSLSGNRAHVKFFDGLEDPSLGVAQMRRFELRQGDIVIPGSSRAHKARVTDDSHWASENEVNAEYTEGPEEGLEFPLAADAVRVPSRVIQSQWKDRVLEVSDISPAVASKTLKDTPSPSKNSVVAAGSARAGRNRLLSKYGIIITQGPGNQNWSREKEKYISIVRDNGGTVLSDWLDIFSLHGKHTNGNKRWTIRRDDVKYTPKDKHSFDRVFLVSDVHNQKPKFLLALALGIPCVSVEWLDHLACGEEVSWSRFLLAAGHSEPLGAPVSQMVDLDWGSSAEHMTEIMENPVPLKVLNGTSVLCVGPELFPQPPKKLMTDADRALEASRTVPRIILTMGADRVEAVADAKHASQALNQYDYVVVKEGIPQPRVRGATYVDVTWIKECLIAGRLFPPTEWGV